MRSSRNKEDVVVGGGGGSSSDGRRLTTEAAKVSMSSPISSSRIWLGRRDPRIVRASRAFGSKDRHSKVKTLKGLRDRRVRLSIPTAIQLYDLQDRLGLSQPSKVVDWLLATAREEIDKLPPLPILPLMQLGEGSEIHYPLQSTATSCMEEECTGSIPSYGSDGTCITPMFTPIGVGNSQFLTSHTEEAASTLLIPSLLPNPSSRQLSFCTAGVMASAPAFVPYVPYTMASSTNLTVDSSHGGFGSLLKSPLFSNKSQPK